MYQDAKFNTDQTQEQLFTEFKRVIDGRDSNIIGKELYDFLRSNIGFNSHHSLQGFREDHAGQGFRDFVGRFDLLNGNQYPWLLNRNSKHYPLIKNMAVYATANASIIYSELDEKQRNLEILGQKPLKKHGLMELVQQEEVVEESLFVSLEVKGQMVIGF